MRKKSENSIKILETNPMILGAEVKFRVTSNALLLDDRSEKAVMKRHLVKQFGQAKGQKIYDQADKMQKAASKAESKVESAAMDIHETSFNLSVHQEIEVNLTPPCNRKAKVIDEVYQLRDIINESDSTSLNRAAESLLSNYGNADEILNDSKARFTDLFRRNLAECRNSNDFECLGKWIYVEAVMRLLNMRPRELERGPKALPHFVPADIKAKIFKDFLKHDRFSPESKDKALCYALVLALLTNRYSLDFTEVNKALKAFKPDHLKRLITVIGAQLHEDRLTGHNFIILGLPLARFQGGFGGPARKKRRTM